MSSNLQEMLARKSAAAAAATTQTNTPKVKQEVEETKEDSKLQEVAEFVPPPGSYRAVRLNQVILRNGSAWRPVNGYYIPETEEQKEHMEYYLEAGQGALVEKVEDKKE